MYMQNYGFMKEAKIYIYIYIYISIEDQSYPFANWETDLNVKIKGQKTKVTTIILFSYHFLSLFSYFL